MIQAMSSGVAKWHGKTIFEQFFKLLTPEQRNNIQLVSGDGAKWIDECIKEYCPNAIIFLLYPASPLPQSP